MTTAGGIADALREFVGDPAGLAEAEVAAVRRRESGSTTMTMPMALPGTSGALPFPDDPLPHGAESEPGTEPLANRSPYRPPSQSPCKPRT